MRTLIVLFGALLVTPAARVSAPVPPLPHHPHDVVTDVDLAPDFAESNTIFVASPGSMSLFLVSQNGGSSWRNSRGGMRGSDVLEFEPASDWAQSGTGYAVLGDGGLQQTTDGGRTWNAPLQRKYLTHLALAPVGADGARALFFGGRTKLWRSDDGGVTAVAVGEGAVNGMITCIGVSPGYEQDGVVAVGTANQHVHVSTDRGATWTSRPIAGQPRRIAVSPTFAQNQALWVATHGAGVQRSMDGGKTYAEAGTLPDRDVNDVVVAQNYPACRDLFVGTREAGVFRSQDGGDTWALTQLRVPLTRQSDNHYTRLALSARYPEDPTIACGSFEGLYISRDAGQTWIESNLDPTRIGRIVQLSPDFENDGTIYANTYGMALLTSADRGETWETRTRLFRQLSTYSIGISPLFAEDRLLLIGVAEGIRRSTDAGKTWEAIELEPLSGKKFWPWEVRTIAYSPDFATDRTVFAACPGGVYRSIDAGKTWTGVPPAADWTWSVALSPTWTADQTMFLAGTSIHRSIDGGRTWGPAVADGDLSVWGWDKFGSLTFAPDWETSGEIYSLAKHAGFVRSTDRGDSWQVVEKAFEGFSGACLRLSPTFLEDGTMYVSTLSGGMFVSRDRGSSWERLTPLGSDVDTCFTFAISKGGVMFGGTYEGYLRSDDSGKTWELVSNLEFYDDIRDPWTYRGTWHQPGYPGAHGYATHASKTAGDVVTLPFTGTGVRVIGVRGPDQGKARVLVDGEVVGEIDNYAAEVDMPTTLYENFGLPYGFHDVTLEVLGTKNEQSSDTWLTIDIGAVAYAAPDGETAAPVFADLSRIVAVPMKGDLDQLREEQAKAAQQQPKEQAQPKPAQPKPAQEPAQEPVPAQPKPQATPKPAAEGEEEADELRKYLPILVGLGIVGVFLLFLAVRSRMRGAA